MRPIREVGESGDLEAMEDDPLLKLEGLREAKLARWQQKECRRNRPPP
jgi:hypothetical protein